MTENKGTPFEEFEAELLSKPGVRKEYEALKPRYDMVRALIRRRTQLGITQAQLAKLVGTKQPAISRLEKGDSDTTLNTFFKVANALDLNVSVTVKERVRSSRAKIHA